MRFFLFFIFFLILIPGTGTIQARDVGHILSDCRIKQGIEAVSKKSDFACRDKYEIGVENARKKLCKDPYDATCRNSKTLVTDSKCRSFLFHPDDMKSLPQYIKASHRFAREETAIRDKMCGSKIKDIMKCVKKMLPEYPKIPYKVYFTEERRKKLTSLFEEIRKLMIKRVQKSAIIRGSARKRAVKRLNETMLALDEKTFGECPVSCSGSLVSPGFAFNALSRDGTRIVCPCTTLMLQLDSMNPSLLYYILGHELGHSLDPCMIEYDDYHDGRFRRENAITELSLKFPCRKQGGDPVKCRKLAELRAYDKSLKKDPKKLSREYYGDYLSCVRGGSCDDSIISCREEDLSDHCENDTNEQECIRELKRMPHCNSGFEDKGVQRDHIGEAVADIWGGGVFADHLAGRSMDERVDAVLSLSQYFTEHENAYFKGCEKETGSKDEHPRGYVRLNHLLYMDGRIPGVLGCTVTPNKPVPRPACMQKYQ